MHVTRGDRSPERTFLGGTAWLAVDTLATRGLLLVALFVAARILDVADFGRLTAVYGTIVLLSGLVSDALRLTVTRQVASAVESDPDMARSTIGVTTTTSVLAAAIVAALLWMLAPFIAATVLSDQQLVDALRVGALILVLESTGAVLSAVLLGLQAFRPMAISGLAGGLPLVPCIAFGAARAGVSGALIGLAAALGLALTFKILMLWRVTRSRGLSPNLRWRPGNLRVLWNLSAPAFLSGLSWAPVNWLGIVMLVNTHDGYLEMGLLGVANQWFAALLFLPNIVGVVLLPSLTAASARGDNAGIVRNIDAGIKANLALVVPMAALVAVLGKYILEFYGPGYAGGWPTLGLVAAAAVAASTLTMFTNLFAAIDRMWAALMTQLAYASAFVLTSFALIRLGWGANAIAAGMVLGYGSKLLATLLLTRRVLSRSAPAPLSSEA